MCFGAKVEMTLPLLDRTKGQDAHFVLTPASAGDRKRARTCGIEGTHVERIPQRALQPSEQYRFHFDMTKCIGCKCCIVACNEQNGNPPTINWRRVGEIEGGWYPATQRSYLSMGCNHCLEPTCLKGCPVDAYSKNPITGVVLHDANACIGCQYCTWNCSYGVPQYDPERGVVGKCDMCHNRLADCREPACVGACPEGAIQIEIVNIEEWEREYAASANAPGLPSADDSISSTRITLPNNLPPDTKRADFYRVKPEHPHWPLVIMTVLTQLSVGAFVTISLLQVWGSKTRLHIAALISFLVAGLALNASTLHLGRPIHAYRALRMWKRSWLSREVLMFGSFSGAAFAYAAQVWFNLPGGLTLGAITSLLGIAGVTASARIYVVPARPAWNTKYTLADFFLTGAVLGPLLALCAGVGNAKWLGIVAAVATGAQLLNLAMKFLSMTASDAFELQASARLLSTQLAYPLLGSAGLLILGGIAAPLFHASGNGALTALFVALGGEIVGRFVFFVSVVPKNMAASYVTVGQAAA